MTNTPTIAEVLHRAADEFLKSDQDIRESSGYGKSRYSCNAIGQAIDSFLVEHSVRNKLEERIVEGLENLGLFDQHRSHFHEVTESKRQAVRYAWLKFAALLAEEQGV